jgi:hypothetical protein
MVVLQVGCACAEVSIKQLNIAKKAEIKNFLFIFMAFFPYSMELLKILFKLNNEEHVK